MTAKPAPRPGGEAFASPASVNQRRYEAIRAYLYEGAPLDEAAARFGYSRSSLASLVRDWRAGKLTLFAEPRRPGRKSAPKKAAARARVIRLRRQGLSVYEISARLAAEGKPLNRTGVGQILAQEGFGRLLRHPEPEASSSPATPGRDTNLPPAKVIDFAAFPGRADTRLAGLLLAVPDLLALDLPALARAAGYPGTRVIPAVSWLLSLLALKLTGTRRVSHVDDLLDDPAAGLFAGLAVLPKKSALTSYSYRLTHDHQRSFLAALDAKLIAAGLAGSDEGIFDLDFHAVMHWGADPVLGELDARGVKFLTLRMRSPALTQHINSLRPADFKTITLDRPGPHNKPKVHQDKAVTLTSYPRTVRQLIVTGLGRDAPTVIITNQCQATIRNLISQYARRMTIEQRLAEIIRSFCADALSSTVNLNVDLDIMLCVMAQALLAAFRTRLGAGYATATPDTLQRRFLDSSGTITTGGDTITVRIDRRAYSPVLRQASLPADTTVPWWHGRRLHFEFS